MACLRAQILLDNNLVPIQLLIIVAELHLIKILTSLLRVVLSFFLAMSFLV